MLAKVWNSYRRWERFLTLLLVLFIFGIVGQWGVSRALHVAGLSAEDRIYTEGLVGSLETINPLFADFDPANRDLSRIIYSGLVTYNPKKQRFEPALATYSINEGVTEYTFTLKKDLFWHDLQPITADDVIFTFNDVIKHPNFNNALLKGAFADVAIEKIDERSVKFTLQQPNAFFLSNMIVGLLPLHIWGEIPVEMIGTSLDPLLMVGSGPFMVKAIELQEETGVKKVILERFKDYYLGKPKLSKMQFYVFSSQDQMLAQQDLLNGIPLVDNEQRDLLVEKFKVDFYQLPQYTALFLNQDNETLQTERMRKILKNAFDKNYLAEALTNREAIGGPYFFLEEIDKIPARDLEPLKQQLDDLGWKVGSDGVREDVAGEKLRFILLVRSTDNSVKQAETDIVVDHIIEAGKELGIRIELSREDGDQFAASLANKAYDIVLFGQDFAYNLDAFAFWHSSQVGPNTFNLSNFKSVSADVILDSLRKTRDQEEQRELLEKLNITLKAEAPAIFLYTQKYIFAFDNSLKNRTILDAYATIADRFYDVHEWDT